MFQGKTRRVDNSYHCNFGAYMPRQLVYEIDQIRGDIPRSRWLRKAAIKELELQKKEEKGALLQGLQVGRQSSQTTQAPGIAPVMVGCDPND